MKNFENYDPSFPDQPVVDLYLQVWANLPAFKSKPAFVWANHDSTTTSSISYLQLNDSVQSISSQLLLHLHRRDIVLLLCAPGLELVEFIFGCQRAGLLCIPISPVGENFHQIERAISQTNPVAVIAHPDCILSVRRNVSLNSSNKRLADMLTNLKWISTIDIKRKKLDHLRVIELDGLCSYDGCKADEAYLIQYTSGATGIPKPVIVKAGSAAHNVRTARKAYDLHPNSVIVSWLPQYHDCGLMFLLLTIVSGSTCVLTSPVEFLRQPRLWLELISEFKATCTPVPSFTLPLVVKRGGIDKGTLTINLSSLRNLVIINEPIYKSSVEEFVNIFKSVGLNPSSISPSYGLAENCTFVSTSWRKTETTIFPNLPTYRKLLPIARLGNRNEDEDMDMDMDILIVNETSHEPVDDGIEGEIWVSSPSNCSGYFGHPALTREIFQARLRNKVTKWHVRTGDRGIIKGKERFLFVNGRCSDIITLPNNREIHPHYIETSSYISSPNFLRGGCIAAFKLSSKTIVLAEMQRSEGNVTTLKNICERIRKSVMEEEKLELDLVVLVKSGSIPKTTSGKIQRWAAMDKLVEGKMNIVMAVESGDNKMVSLRGLVVHGKSISVASDLSSPPLLSLL